MEKDNSYYGDNGDSSTPDEAGAQSPDAAPENSDATDNSQTALLPKEFFGSKDLTVGSECQVKIVHVFDDEVEVQYESKEPDSDTDDSTPSNAMSQIEKMAQPAQPEGS